MYFKSLALATFGLVLAAPFASAQDAKSLTGVVSDSMCGKKHMMSDKSAAECTRACVKGGSDYALVVGDKVYTLKGDDSKLDKFAGEKVTVNGKLSGSTVTMESIKAAQ